MTKTPFKESSKEQNQPDPVPKPSKSAEVSPFIEAFRMLSHIITAICLMLICGGLGYAIDYYLGIKGIALVGFLTGGTFAIKHLIAVTSQTPEKNCDLEKK